MHIETLNFVAKTQCLTATKVCPSNSSKPNILTLHGLGPTASRHSIRYVLDYLVNYGYASMCFDFSGNGDSSGLLKDSCLLRRRVETLAAAKHLNKELPPVLIGTSMGGSLAAWLTPLLHPRTLILFCPAAYSKNAVDLKFDNNFERPGRYIDSLAYSGIRKFNGDLLIIAARNDLVVPPDIIEGYLENAKDARTKRVIWLDECDHYIHGWLQRHEKLKKEVLKAILHTISMA